MPLTAAQITDIRWFMGYSVRGSDANASTAEPVYTRAAPASVSLETRLATLSAAEESRVTAHFLPNLHKREAEVQGTAASLDTAQAAVWTRNPREMDERRRLFNDLRRDLCAFLGFPPGSGLFRSHRVIRG